MGKLKPFLLTKDAKSQAEFYAQSLGGEIVSVLTYEQAMGVQNELKDKVIHLCVRVAGENFIFMADALEPVTQGNDILLNIAFGSEDAARSAFEKLVVNGHVIKAFEQQPYGMFIGELTDRYGVNWMISTE